MTIEPMPFEEMPRPVQKLLRGMDMGLTFAMDAAGAAIEAGAYTAAGIFGLTCVVGGPIIAVSGVVIGVEHTRSGLDATATVALGGFLTCIGPGFVKDAIEYYREIPEHFRTWRKTRLTTMLP